MKQLLDVYTFQLQKKVSGKYQQETASFDEVAKDLIAMNPNKNKMAAFLQEIVKTLDTAFLVSLDSSKAICFKDVGNFSVSEDSNILLSAKVFLSG